MGTAYRLMMSERQRRHGQAVQPLLVGSRGSYRQQALSSQACSEADSSQISVSGYATAPADMLAALDEARLDAEEVGPPPPPHPGAPGHMSPVDTDSPIGC